MSIFGNGDMRRKIVMLGEMAVGKTSLVRRMVLGKFESDYKSTIGHNIFVLSLNGLGPSRDQLLDLLIWDTDGGVGASAFRIDGALKGAVAAVIVGDVTRPRTLSIMAELARECAHHLPAGYVNFLFNKIDLLSEPLRIERPPELAVFEHKSFETSAKTGHEVPTAFTDVANAILRRHL
jgi:GTPase SAR1 family protein